MENRQSTDREISRRILIETLDEILLACDDLKLILDQNDQIMQDKALPAEVA